MVSFGAIRLPGPGVVEGYTAERAGVLPHILGTPPSLRSHPQPLTRASPTCCHISPINITPDKEKVLHS